MRVQVLLILLELGAGACMLPQMVMREYGWVVAMVLLVQQGNTMSDQMSFGTLVMMAQVLA